MVQNDYDIRSGEFPDRLRKYEIGLKLLREKLDKPTEEEVLLNGRRMGLSQATYLFYEIFPELKPKEPVI